MYGIFMECYVALRQYFGGESAGDIRAYLNMIVFIASAIFIMIKASLLSLSHSTAL